jgi:Protein of unknown function (DUF1173)
MLIQSLIEGGRSFTKTLRYDIPEEATIAAAILKDVGAEGVALFLDDGSRAEALRQALEDCPIPTWAHPRAHAAVLESDCRRKSRSPTHPNQPASPRLATVSIGFIRLAPVSGSLPAPFSQVETPAAGRIELRRPPPAGISRDTRAIIFTRRPSATRVNHSASPNPSAVPLVSAARLEAFDRLQVPAHEALVHGYVCTVS